MQRSLSILCVLLLAQPLVLGCTDFKPPPTYPREDPGYGSPIQELTGLDSDPPPPLALLRGDVINVGVTSAESSAYTGLIVDSEGKVHVPAIGPVPVAGMTPQQAEKAIEAVIQKSDRFARISVLVSAWSGHNASVIGAVTAEGPRPVTPGMRLAELVAAAGGPLRSTNDAMNYVADLDGARLVRAGKEVPVSLRLAMLGDPRHNVLIHAGDELFVPAGLGNRIAIIGEDSRGSMLIYRPGLRLTEALASTGGVSFVTDTEDIRIIRGPLKKPTIYQYNLDKFVNGHMGDVELAPGDVVFVSRHWSATMTEVINKIVPVLGLALGIVNTVLLFQNLNLTQKIRSEQEMGNTVTPVR
jgi:polysaccharide export outer membrane protein